MAFGCIKPWMERTFAVFDIDGMLVDTPQCYEQACMDAFREHGVQLSQKQFIRWNSEGIPTREWMRRLRITNAHIMESIRERRNELYLQLIPAQAKWIDGAQPMLEELRAHQPIIAVTNADKEFIALLTDVLQLPDHIDTIIHPAQEGIRKKPDPSGLLRASEIAGKQPWECLFAGDQEFDVRAARNAQFMACLFRGSHTLREAEDLADVVIHHPREVLPIAAGEREVARRQDPPYAEQILAGMY